MALTKLNYTGQGTIPIANIPTITAKMPAGSVLQTIQVVKTNTFTTGATTTTDIPGLSVAITPQFSNSKILVRGYINLGTNSSSFISLLMSRNSTQIFQGDAEGSRPRVTAMSYQENNPGIINTYTPEFLDSPSTTSSVTYKLQVRVGSGGGIATVNRSSRHSNNTTFDMVTASSITVMEIKG